MSDWTAFWLLCAVFIGCEAVVTVHGIDTYLWKFKTPVELEIQRSLGTCAARGGET